MSRPLHRFLGSADALARLQDHARRLLQLQRTLASALPDALAEQCQVVNLKEGRLVIHCSHGAAAVRLKQLQPRVLSHFARAGHALDAITIKVRPPAAQALRPAPETRAISAQARAHLEHFAAALPADSELRAALERLAERSREPPPMV